MVRGALLHVVCESASAHGESPGVHFEPLPGREGLFVTNLVRGGLAEESGEIQLHDQLINLNNEPVYALPNKTCALRLSLLSAFLCFVKLLLCTTPNSLSSSRTAPSASSPPR